MSNMNLTWAEFQPFWNRKVIVSERNSRTTYVGILVQETNQFLTLKDAKVVVNGRAKDCGLVAIWKGKIGVIKLAEEQPGEEDANTKDSKA
ncbi:hypothetical protein [Thermococcus paralvinellae]|uniref:hypothetical protein n=1 Tax=Thermococcus paralvinellae TaxID=582419 RepID=UPI0005B2BDAD|nr:hypothetical protein [Thermococcus paralvinellae]